MRYIAAIASVLFLVFAFKAPTPGLLGFAILMTLACSTAAVFGFAAARIDDRSKDQVYIPSDEEKELLRKIAQRKQPPAGGPPAGGA